MEHAARRPALAHFLDAQRLAFGPLMFQAVRAARDMGVLGALDAAGQAGLLPGEVAERAGVSLYAARVLLEACLSAGVCEVEGWRFRLTRAGRLVLRDEMTRVNMDFVHHVCFRGAFELERSLREGRPAGLATLGPWSTVYEGLSRLDPEVQRAWFAFDHFYSDAVFAEALSVLLARRPTRVLDVGGNTGRFATACARRDPGVEVTILDHPGQLALAAREAEAAGVGPRVKGAPIELLDHRLPFPTGFDVVWMSQLLDCFPERDVVGLLRRGGAALKPGGRLYVSEPCWDRQPNEVGRYCLHATSLYFTAIANGTSRMYHSEDLAGCIAAAGMVLEEDRPLGSTHTLFVCRPG
ncbi:MAG TPA: class I SAM-dependent methyltransferase [Anaeromyxobacter sp.]|nr:class I SAM-dependent methyltransferase [Anaeromyxobacter sp.]